MTVTKNDELLNNSCIVSCELNKVHFYLLTNKHLILQTSFSPWWKTVISSLCYCQKLRFCNQRQQVKTQQTPPDHHKGALHKLQLFFPHLSNCQRRFLLLITFPFFFSLLSPWRPSISFTYRICVKWQINTKSPPGSQDTLSLCAGLTSLLFNGDLY